MAVLKEDTSVGGVKVYEHMPVYGTCATASSTTAKEATAVTGFALATGTVVLIKFTNANTATSPTLNVSGTGAKYIKKYGTTGSMAYMWQAGETLEFVYDGTYWMMIRGGIATTSYYGVTVLSSSTSSTSTTSAATPSAVKTAYDLAASKCTLAEVNTAIDTAINGAIAASY